MIPIYKPYLNGNEKKYINDCIDSTWISSKGKYIEKFEEKIKTYVGRKYASSCSNGTVALDLAMKSIGLKQGDEVITTSFTYVASTNAILNNGATPIFVDIENDSWNINCDLIEKAISNKTKAILISNVYGYLPDVSKLLLICKKHNLILIEDAAESFGSTFEKIKSGNIGLISTFSFFGNKTITTGEGGMVLTNNKKIYELVEKLKNQGNSTKRKYYHDILGFNYRMTNIQAAIGLAQIEQIDKILLLKRNIFNYYYENLSNIVKFQKPINKQIQSSYWIISIVFENVNLLKYVINDLEKESIETRPLFYPVDELKFYKASKTLTNTKNISNRGLCLPSYPGLSINELEKIVHTIQQSHKNYYG